MTHSKSAVFLDTPICTPDCDLLSHAISRSPHGLLGNWHVNHADLNTISNVHYSAIRMPSNEGKSVTANQGNVRY